MVLLGAGASVAALPNGDKNGRFLPTMDNFVSKLQLEPVLSNGSIDYIDRNFEAIFSEIHSNPDLNELQNIIEIKVREYFKGLELPDTPTLYDHLLLSLRKKDIIATFNWDPFLVQAYRRVSGYTRDLPAFLFLHGNVMTGYCPEHEQRGAIDAQCKICHRFYTPSRLLFPVGKKDYNHDIYIKKEWEIVKWALESSFMLTIFGYSAPSTDIEAMELMKSAWNGGRDGSMEQIEIIDIESEDEVTKTWNGFIYSHHFDHFSNFYDSWIPNHPRRTYEAYFNQYWEAKFIDNNPIPVESSFDELWDWFGELIKYEQVSKGKNI